MSVGADPALNGSSLSTRVSASATPAGACASALSRSVAPAAIRAGEPEPRALALVGEGAERSEVEIVLRRNLLQARIQHRLEPGARQRMSLDRRAKRERDRIAGRLIRPFAADGFAPPGEPDRRQIGIARAPQRMADFRVERRERGKTAAGALVRIERAEPLIAGVSAGERGAMLGSFRERVGAPRGRRAFTAWG